VSIGCILGMVPLLFYKPKKKKKEEEEEENNDGTETEQSPS